MEFQNCLAFSYGVVSSYVQNLISYTLNIIGAKGQKEWIKYYDIESNILLIWDVHLFLNYFVLIKLPYERIITTNNTTEFISNLYDGSYCV